MRKLITLAMLLAMSGCAFRSDNQKCEEYGFTPGTDAFAGCRQEADAERAATRRTVLGVYLFRHML